jgi:hypothetical protein
MCKLAPPEIQTRRGNVCDETMRCALWGMLEKHYTAGEVLGIYNSVTVTATYTVRSKLEDASLYSHLLRHNLRTALSTPISLLPFRSRGHPRAQNQTPEYHPSQRCSPNIGP